MNKWNYGGAHERFPIEDGELWEVDGGRGLLKVHDLYDELPHFTQTADMIIVDPPWNLGNVNTFYTKAEKQGEHQNTYHEFYVQLFKQIDVVNPHTIFIEIGKQNVENFIAELEQRFKFVQKWDITYYKKYPCHYLRASNRSTTNFDYSNWDEWDAILKSLEIEDYETVLDLCMGQGLVAEGAYVNGKKFIGLELNKKRLAVVIERIAKLGGTWNVKEL